MRLNLRRRERLCFQWRQFDHSAFPCGGTNLGDRSHDLCPLQDRQTLNISEVDGCHSNLHLSVQVRRLRNVDSSLIALRCFNGRRIYGNPTKICKSHILRMWLKAILPFCCLADYRTKLDDHRIDQTSQKNDPVHFPKAGPVS